MELFFPFLLIIFASVFQGSFGLGMKYMEPLKWESWWLVHVTIAMVLIPVVWAAIVVPEFTTVIDEAFTNPEMSAVVYSAMFFGFLWGIGGIMFRYASIILIGFSIIRVLTGICCTNTFDP